jgi:hypothetical protein
MRTHRYVLTALAVMTMLVGLSATSLAQDDTVEGSYRATLQPLNQNTVGSNATGQVLITVAGDQITFQVQANEVPPDIEHWQHIHGFATGDQASSCPTGDADTNGDGVIDLIETEDAAGTTMIPLNDDPAGFDIPADTYPVADDNGTYTYEATADMEDLESAFDEHFPDAGGLNLENRVVFIHGVPEGTDLPDSVQSLGDIPATTTLPIACGTIERTEAGTPIATPVASPEATPAA